MYRQLYIILRKILPDDLIHGVIDCLRNLDAGQGKLYSLGSFIFMSFRILGIGNILFLPVQDTTLLQSFRSFDKLIRFYLCLINVSYFTRGYIVLSVSKNHSIGMLRIPIQLLTVFPVFFLLSILHQDLVIFRGIICVKEDHLILFRKSLADLLRCFIPVPLCILCKEDILLIPAEQHGFSRGPILADLKLLSLITFKLPDIVVAEVCFDSNVCALILIHQDKPALVLLQMLQDLFRTVIDMALGIHGMIDPAAAQKGCKPAGIMRHSDHFLFLPWLRIVFLYIQIIVNIFPWHNCILLSILLLLFQSCFSITKQVRTYNNYEL